MKIAILLYDKFTALDAIGPYEVLSRLPGADLAFVAAEPGPVVTDNGAPTVVAGISPLRDGKNRRPYDRNDSLKFLRE